MPFNFKTYKALLCSAALCAGFLNISPLKAGITPRELNKLINVLSEVSKPGPNPRARAEAEKIMKEFEKAGFKLDINKHDFGVAEDEILSLIKDFARMARKGDREAKEVLGKLRSFYAEFRKHAKAVGTSKAPSGAAAAAAAAATKSPEHKPNGKPGKRPAVRKPQPSRYLEASAHKGNKPPSAALQIVRHTAGAAAAAAGPGHSEAYTNVIPNYNGDHAPGAHHNNQPRGGAARPHLHNRSDSGPGEHSHHNASGSSRQHDGYHPDQELDKKGKTPWLEGYEHGDNRYENYDADSDDDSDDDTSSPRGHTNLSHQHEQYHLGTTDRHDPSFHMPSPPQQEHEQRGGNHDKNSAWWDDSAHNPQAGHPHGGGNRGAHNSPGWPPNGSKQSTF